MCYLSATCGGWVHKLPHDAYSPPSPWRRMCACGAKVLTNENPTVIEFNSDDKNEVPTFTLAAKRFEIGPSLTGSEVTDLFNA